MLFILDLQRIAKAKVKSRRGLGRTGVLSDRKKHGYLSQNALRNTLACFLAGEGTPLPPIQGVFLRIIILFFKNGRIYLITT